MTPPQILSSLQQQQLFNGVFILIFKTSVSFSRRGLPTVDLIALNAANIHTQGQLSLNCPVSSVWVGVFKLPAQFLPT